ncbi:MAG: DNA methyltransferase [Phycisphaerae bacterium]|nr:DNA methyltransferase [Phycisphaerae bacterium]
MPTDQLTLFRDLNSSNKLQEKDLSIHQWYRFVLSYPPHLVRYYLEEFGISSDHTVLDPFCGTGTTMVECKKKGIPSIGIEANEIAAFAARVKTHWDVDVGSFQSVADRIAKAAQKRLKQEGIHDGDTENEQTPEAISLLRKLSPDTEKLLLKNSISPYPLHKTLVLLDVIEKQKSDYADYYKLALATALVTSIGNLHFGPEVGVRHIKKDSQVISSWLDRVHEMARDLHDISSPPIPEAVVHHADSREIQQILSPGSVDAVITSPPYPNEKDYTRTTRLESVLLGFLRDRPQLRAMKKNLLRSNTRGVYKEDDDDVWVAQYAKICAIADEIEQRRISMGKTSGFERLYARVTKLYFGGMRRHLAELRTILRPGAHLAYVVGDQASYLRVMIRTGKLLAMIAESLGYQVIRIDLFRERLATATREMLREEVLVLRWPGESPED